MNNENQCAICGLGQEWQGKELILVLDYINGIRTDQRSSNLRLLCPNCNSQQYNPIIKYKNQSQKLKKPCNRCGMPASMNSKSGLCKACSSIISRQKDWPSADQLAEDIENLSWRAIGKKYNVSDNSVRRWAKHYGLI